MKLGTKEQTRIRNRVDKEKQALSDIVSQLNILRADKKEKEFDIALLCDHDTETIERLYQLAGVQEENFSLLFIYDIICEPLFVIHDDLARIEEGLQVCNPTVTWRYHIGLIELGLD